MLQLAQRSVQQGVVDNHPLGRGPDPGDGVGQDAVEGCDFLGRREVDVFEVDREGTELAEPVGEGGDGRQGPARAGRGPPGLQLPQQREVGNGAQQGGGVAGQGLEALFAGHQVEQPRETAGEGVDGTEVGVGADAEAQADMAAERAEYDARYKEIESRLGALHADFSRDSLTARDANGKEVEISLGKVVHAYQPNAMGVATKRDQERTLHALNQIQSRLNDNPEMSLHDLIQVQMDLSRLVLVEETLARSVSKSSQNIDTLLKSQ